MGVRASGASADTSGRGIRAAGPAGVARRAAGESLPASRHHGRGSRASHSSPSPTVRRNRCTLSVGAGPAMQRRARPPGGLRRRSAGARHRGLAGSLIRNRYLRSGRRAYRARRPPLHPSRVPAVRLLARKLGGDHPDGSPAGTSIISRDLDGCALIENYALGGYVGRSSTHTMRRPTGGISTMSTTRARWLGYSVASMPAA